MASMRLAKSLKRDARGTRSVLRGWFDVGSGSLCMGIPVVQQIMEPLGFAKQHRLKRLADKPKTF
jgi:hypothetical protein